MIREKSQSSCHRPLWVVICVLTTLLLIHTPDTMARWGKINTYEKEFTFPTAGNSALQDSKNTDRDKDLMDEYKTLREEANDLSEDWTDQYFALVSEVQEREEKLQRYKSLISSIASREEVIKTFKDNLESLKSIFEYRLKAIPYAYLVLSYKKDDMIKRSGMEIYKELHEQAKLYLRENYSPISIYSETRIKNLQLVKDRIEAESSCRIESFESDPIYQNTEDKFFFMIHAFRIFNEFKPEKKVESGSDSETDKINPDINFIRMDAQQFDDENTLPQWIKERIKNNEKFQNGLRRKQKNTRDINNDQIVNYVKVDSQYLEESSRIRAKKKKQENELIKETSELKREFANKEYDHLKIDLKTAQDNLNEHVLQREMIVFTVQKEVVHIDQTIETLHEKLAINAYKTLKERATQLYSYRFFSVENGVLTNWKAKDYYSDPTPVQIAVPLKSAVYINDESGGYRCGVLMGLRVRLKMQNRNKRYNQEGEGVVQDLRTKLEWLMGPDKDTSWSEARKWVRGLHASGGRWRMPTPIELKSLFDHSAGENNITPLLQTGGWLLWSGETDRKGNAQIVDFSNGEIYPFKKDYNKYLRCIAVRCLLI